VALRRGTSLCVFLCVWGNFGELPYCVRGELLSRACVGGKRFDLRTTFRGELFGERTTFRNELFGERTTFRTSCLVREQPLGRAVW
jgi:hypothetical protein